MALKSETKTIADRIIIFQVLSWIFLLAGIIYAGYVYLDISDSYKQANEEYKNLTNQLSISNEIELSYSAYFTSYSGRFLISIMLLLLALFFQAERNHNSELLSRL